MAEGVPDSQNGQTQSAPEQLLTTPALNGTSLDVEMSEDRVPSESTSAIPSNTPVDTLTSTTAPTPSIPIASTATPPAPMVASPAPSQPGGPAPRTSSNPPTTPSAATSLAPPPAPSPHGSPTRVYLNQNVTPHLLEGVKYLAVYEPEKPLKWLAEFLGERSREIEGT